MATNSTYIPTGAFVDGMCEYKLTTSDTLIQDTISFGIVYGGDGITLSRQYYTLEDKRIIPYCVSDSPI